MEYPSSSFLVLRWKHILRIMTHICARSFASIFPQKSAEAAVKSRLRTRRTTFALFIMIDVYELDTVRVLLEVGTY